MADRVEIGRSGVLAFRLARQQVTDADSADDLDGDVELLDYGVQDTGTDGGEWALRIRGAQRDARRTDVLAWTIRGAPHRYRRSDLDEIVVASAPLSEADAAARIYDAAKPLKAAGLAVLDALTTVAAAMREIVTAPTPKGELSRQLTLSLGGPYVRFCRPCDVVHVYEMPFRLAALQAGLQLDPGTSPPVLRPIEGLEPSLFRRPASGAHPRFDVIRNYLRFYGPARIADAARFLDAPARAVRASWPTDTVEVQVTDEPPGAPRTPRFVLSEDLGVLRAASQGGAAGTRLLGPFDPFLQLRDRHLLVPDEARRKELWRTLGRPGALLHDGELRGTWRPSTKNRKLTIAVSPWEPLSEPVRRRFEAEAGRLADHRGLPLGGVAWE